MAMATEHGRGCGHVWRLADGVAHAHARGGSEGGTRQGERAHWRVQGLSGRVWARQVLANAVLVFGQGGRHA
jgi:hypothetical protein